MRSLNRDKLPKHQLQIATHTLLEMAWYVLHQQRHGKFLAVCTGGLQLLLICASCLVLPSPLRCKETSQSVSSHQLAVGNAHKPAAAFSARRAERSASMASATAGESVTPPTRLYSPCDVHANKRGGGGGTLMAWGPAEAQ
jgi:hypothetical protein